MDVKISNTDSNFKYRINTILIHNNKVLLVEINNSGYFCCPGGHVHIGETSKEALTRETLEEVEIKVKNEKCIALIENFFKNNEGKSFHAVEIYYTAEPINLPKEKLKDYVFIENDEGKPTTLNFKWFPLNDLASQNIKPIALRDKLAKNDFDFEHIFVRDNKILEKIKPADTKVKERAL